MLVVGVVVGVIIVIVIGLKWKKPLSTQRHRATAVVVHSTTTSSYPNNSFTTDQTNSGYIAGNDYSTTTDTAFGGTSFR